jgi:hypothetical protein
MKLPSASNSLFGWVLIVIALAATACDPAPIPITGSWVAAPVLLDSGWCRTTWTFSADEQWRAVHVFSEDSSGTVIIRREQTFGLWLFEPGAEHQASNSPQTEWRLALMINGIERSRVRGYSQPEPWVPFEGNRDGWAYPLGPSWPRSYGFIRQTSPDEIELAVEKEGQRSSYRRLTRAK